MALEAPEFIPTKSYTFAKLRELLAMTSLSQGVVAREDLRILQREAGANMSVDVLVGDVWVTGTSISRQGIYHTNNTARTNVSIPTSSKVNPRVDQVILAVNDSSVIGASDIPAFKVMEGVPTSGTQITEPLAAKYRVGAKTDAEIKAEWPNYILLADVLVGTSVTEIKTANIMDRRTFARGSLDLTVPIERTGANIILAYGEHAVINTNAGVGWLPVPLDGEIVEVTCAGGIAECKLKTISGNIFGDYTASAAGITLLTNQHIKLVGYQGSFWLISSGEPKREQAYENHTVTKAELEGAGFTPSTVRPSHVIIGLVSTELSVGPTLLLQTSNGVFSVYVNPGEKLTGKSANATMTAQVKLL